VTNSWFPEDPDWRSPFVESLSWATDISLSEDGLTETRRLARLNPRRLFRLSHTFFDALGFDLDMLANFADKRIVPFPPGAYLRESGVSGAGSVVIEWAQARGFEPGGFVLAIGPADTIEGLNLITGVTAGQFGSVTIDGSITFSAGARLYPAFEAELLSAVQASRVTPGIALPDMVWRVTSPTRWPFSPTATDLETELDPRASVAGVEVFDDEIDHSDALGSNYSRRFFDVESPSGAPGFRQPRDFVTVMEYLQSFRYFSHHEIWKARRHLYRRRGRFHPALTRQGFADLDFLRTEDVGGDLFLVFREWDDADLPTSRQAISITRTDGTKHHAVIAQSATNADNAGIPVGERWVLPFPQLPAALSSVAVVDWLVYARLSSDEVTITYPRPGVAEIGLTWWALEREVSFD
jgi:hypothetical protein